MIKRENWQLVNDYLEYRQDVDQISKSSKELEETWLKHLLRWADDNSFDRAPKIRPTFPQYILTARLDGKDKPLSAIYVSKVVGAAKRFLEWLRMHRVGYKTKLRLSWLDTLKPPRMEEEPSEHEAVTIEEIRAMAEAPAETMREQRIKAAAVFWFLSGIRIGAFVTLPLKAIDMQERAVKQWPSLGVKTKFKKHANTFLLNIPDLLEVVKAWDDRARAHLPLDGFWFAPFSPQTGTFDPNIKEVGKHRGTRARKDLQAWLDRVGLEYHSPHKFRHGHAVYALKQSDTTADLKAVSMNLMHSSLRVTDEIYSILSGDDIQERIANLGGNGSGMSKEDAERIAELVAEKLLQKS